jgi:hypothetical protein
MDRKLILAFAGGAIAMLAVGIFVFVSQPGVTEAQMGYSPTGTVPELSSATSPL